MEKNALPQRSDELEQEKRARKWLELEVAIAQSEVANCRVVQAEMEFALQCDRDKYQQLEEKHAKKEVMKDKLIKKIAQIEESVLKVVKSNKQITMKFEFQGLLECEEMKREVMQSQLLEELAGTKKKLVISEASLGVKAQQYCNLDEERHCMQKDMNKLEKMVQNCKDQSNQSVHYIHTMKCALDHKEQEVFATFQKLQEVMSASAAMDETIKQLEMSLRQMEIENTKLKDAAKKQTNSCTVLQNKAEEAALANKDLTERLNREVQKQNLLYIYSHGQLKEKETALLKEKQKVSEDKSLQEALQKQLEKVQNEGVLLCQQLEEAKKKAEVKQQEVIGLQEHLKNMCTESEMLAMNKETIAELQESIVCERKNGQSTLRKLQQELGDTQKRLSMCEESLEGNALHCKDLEKEKLSMEKNMSMLKQLLQESEDKCTQSESCVHNLITKLKEKDCEIVTSSQKLQVCPASRSQKPACELQEYLDREKADRQSTLWQLQKELTDTKMKLSMCEASLQANTHHCRDLEEEKQSMQKDMNTIKERLQESEDKCVQSEQRMHKMKTFCDDKDNQIYTLSKKLHVSTSSSKESTSKNSELQEQLDSEETDRQGTLRQLQKELTDTKIKLSICEASLQANTHHCRDVEEEKQSMQKDMNILKETLQESEDKCVQSERRMHSMKTSCDDKDHQICNLHEKLQVFSASVGTDKTFKQLEQSLETENTNLQATAEQQISIIAKLQNEVEEAARLKKDLEEQLKPEQSSLSLNAHEGITGRIAALLVEKENAIAQQEALQKQLEHVQLDNTVLHQQLKESHEDIKEQACMQNNRLAKMQAHYEKKVQELEKRSKELVAKYSGLYKCPDSEKTGGEHNWRQVQQELADTQSKSSMNNVPLEVIAHHCISLEDKERSNMEEDLKRLEKMIKESENLAFS